MDITANIVRIRTEFKREMVNATLKIMERAMRDYKAIRDSYDENNPRAARAFARADKIEGQVNRMKGKANRIERYWSDTHESGANWPVPPRYGNDSYEPKEAEEPDIQPESQTPAKDADETENT